MRVECAGMFCIIPAYGCVGLVPAGISDAADTSGEKTAAAKLDPASTAAAPGAAVTDGNRAADAPPGPSSAGAQHALTPASEDPAIPSTAKDQPPDTAAAEAEHRALPVSAAPAGRLQVASQRNEETRTITLKDVVALLERDSMYSSSTALYKLYDRLHEPT